MICNKAVKWYLLFYLRIYGTLPITHRYSNMFSTSQVFVETLDKNIWVPRLDGKNILQLITEKRSGQESYGSGCVLTSDKKSVAMTSKFYNKWTFWKCILFEKLLQCIQVFKSKKCPALHHKITYFMYYISIVCNICLFVGIIFSKLHNYWIVFQKPDAKPEKYSLLTQSALHICI